MMNFCFWHLIGLNFYLNKGYFKAEVSNSFASHTGENNFELTFTINAGNKYYLNNLKKSFLCFEIEFINFN